ncbi:MAG: hypothetical protein E7474_01315 [Ruminococcaceae bacterium]|nr:hypothetical protein [Oscillospiraceae bacterium]
MSELKRRCAQLSLSDADIARIEQVEAQLPLIAEVTNADAFIDVAVDDERAMVVAQARPSRGTSVYAGNILGAYAYREDEPAVFHALRAGVPVCDLKARTQEGRTVRQNVAPILGDDGETIAVLIREKDVSDDLQQQRKYEELARSYERRHDPIELSEGAGVNELREMHHRVKNDLQLVASILRMEARSASQPEAQKILDENVGRVLSIAAIHDMLSYHPGAENTAGIGSLALLGRLCEQLSALVPPGQDVVIRAEGDDIPLDEETATPVAVVVTELVTNAILHAFPQRRGGTVTVSVLRGTMFHTVSVRDDGAGFLPAEEPEGLGLSIVRATVRDKLGGLLRISSDSRGTKASFDFKTGE